MKLASRIAIGAGCFALLAVSWIIALSSKTDAEKQFRLILQAGELFADEIYISAVELLEEAASYDEALKPFAEEQLKYAYGKLFGTRGYRKKYTDLLDAQMNRPGAPPEVFIEAAQYYLDISKISEALAALKDGIAKTGDGRLVEIYEANRYFYRANRTSFDFVTETYDGKVQVKKDGLWGIADSEGHLVIPCAYESLSTFYGDRAIAVRENETFAIDINDNRVAKLHHEASGIGNYAEDRVGLLIGGVWRRSAGDLVPGSMEFQQICMYSNGYAAAKADGKWGVIDRSSNWLIAPEYDGIVVDRLGRCYAQNALFAKHGGAVWLIRDGARIGGPYEDARPFSDEGYAAVKMDGKWGFIDAEGGLMIDFRYGDALSFGQHLAAVKVDEHWGYISLEGKIAIAPIFEDARSFSQGSAPVLTERGWEFITLHEYRRMAGL